jgi:hypothetical protein
MPVSNQLTVFPGTSMMGVGGAHGSTLAAFLDLPLPLKWGRQFYVLEDYTYEVIQQVKIYHK